MTFDEFKRMTYHTRTRIRIPGSRSVIDKTNLVTKKGKFDFDRADKLLLEIYTEEQFNKK